MDHPETVRVLGLFSGIGGLERGVASGLRRLGLDARHVCLVEGEAFGAGCLEAAMRRGELAPCPIWLGDVREFPAAEFAGAVDLVVAGFPCQPASSAGQRRGTDDARWLWPEVVRVAQESRARYIFGENVRGLLSVNGGDGFAQVLESLADIGFDAEWTVLSASAVGAPHRRERVFIFAWRRDVGDAQDSHGRAGSEGVESSSRVGRRGLGGAGVLDVADSGRRGDERRDDAGGMGEVQGEVEGGARERERTRDDARDSCETLADGGRERREGLALPGAETGATAGRGGGAGIYDHGFPSRYPPGPAARDEWRRIIATDPGLAPAVEPRFFVEWLQGFSRGLTDPATWVPSRRTKT